MLALTYIPLLSCQASDSGGPSTVVVKIVKVSPASAAQRCPDSQHSVSILEPTQGARISFSAVYQPSNLIERPKVCNFGQVDACVLCCLGPGPCLHTCAVRSQYTALLQREIGLPITGGLCFFPDQYGRFRFLVAFPGLEHNLNTTSTYWCTST